MFDKIMTRLGCLYFGSWCR